MTEHDRTSRSQVAVEESFVVDVQSFLQELMNVRGMNRSKLAEAMGVSRARITQIFSDECTNLTIRLLARAVHALGDEPEVTSRIFRELREKRNEARRAELIQASENVVPLGSAWIDDTVERPASEEACSHQDTRLDALVQRARRVAGGHG